MQTNKYNMKKKKNSYLFIFQIEYNLKKINSVKFIIYISQFN